MNLTPIEDLYEFKTARGAVASWFNENFSKIVNLLNDLVSQFDNKLEVDLSNIIPNYETILQPSYIALSYNGGGISLETNKSYYYTLTMPTTFILPTSTVEGKYNNVTVDIYVPNYQQDVTFFQFNEDVGWINPGYGIDRPGVYKVILDKVPFSDVGYNWTCSISWVAEVASVM